MVLCRSKLHTCQWEKHGMIKEKRQIGNILYYILKEHRNLNYL